MSAYTAIEVMSDFNKTPLAPPVCKVVIHENPDARRTWAPHGSGGGTLDLIWSTTGVTIYM